MQRGWQRAAAAAVRLLAGGFTVALCVAASSSAISSHGKYPELDKAIAALKHEYAAHVKDPEHERLRSDASYFKKDSVPCPPDAILALLEKPIPGVVAGDQRQVAYIRWQLLSALPEKLDEETARRLVKVYQRAPVPAARFGSSKQDQRQLDSLLVGARLQDDVKLTEGLEQMAARAAVPDRPVIAFRDELYRRLPLGRDRLEAGMADAETRLKLGAEKETLAELLTDDLSKWSTSPDAPRAQVRELADDFGRLRIVESPPYYAYASVRSGKLGWRTRTDTLLTKRKLAALHKQLLDAAAARDVPPPAQNAKKNGSAEPTKKAGKSS